MRESAIYVLTRGYHGIRKYRYLKLIKRNISIRRSLGNRVSEFDLIVFHEGNIGKWDMKLISVMSKLDNIKFIDVGEEFMIPPNVDWSNRMEHSISYALMCRFQYFGVWKYLSQYIKVVRIDEDCVIQSLPKDIADIKFACGVLINETHTLTNRTLKAKLDVMGMGKFYDQEFPYTNVFIADVKTWLQPEIQTFLSTLAFDRQCLENRWGDLPILGVAAKAFGVWGPKAEVLKEISYFHGSHSIPVNMKVD